MTIGYNYFRIKYQFFGVLILAILASAHITIAQAKSTQLQPVTAEYFKAGFVNATDFGFFPDASGIENTKALQRAVDQGGTIIVGQPGTYKMAGTVYIGSNTSYIGSNTSLAARAGNEDAVLTFNDGSYLGSINKPIIPEHDYLSGEQLVIIDGKLRLGLKKEGYKLYLPETAYVEGTHCLNHTLLAIDAYLKF